MNDSDVMLDAVTDRGIVRLDPLGRIVRWSAGAQALLGYSSDEVVGQPVSMFHCDDRTDQEPGADGPAEHELAAVREHGQVEFEDWRMRKDGHRFRAAVRVSAIPDQHGPPAGFVMVMRDLAADQQRAHPMFYELLEAAPDAMVIAGPDGRIAFANAQTDRMFGYPRAELIGSEVEKLVPVRFQGRHVGHRAQFFAEPLLRPMLGGLDLWGLRQDGTEFPVDISLSPLNIDGTLYVSAAIRDITERHQCEKQLRYQHEQLIETHQELERSARIDALTGLANHAETIRRLEAALGRHQDLPAESHLGVLFCDADHFKAINDTWGHAAGDVVLSSIAGRIRECVRISDTVGRIGGDEMMVLLPGVHGIGEVVHIAEKIRQAAAEPIHHFDHTISATVSIGATLAIRGESVAAMTSRADAAMYKAKQSGRNTVTTI